MAGKNISIGNLDENKFFIIRPPYANREGLSVEIYDSQYVGDDRITKKCILVSEVHLTKVWANGKYNNRAEIFIDGIINKELGDNLKVDYNDCIKDESIVADIARIVYDVYFENRKTNDLAISRLRAINVE